jgi:hypothetical protein
MTFDQKVKRTPAQIGKANSEKGKWAERQVANYLRTAGFPGAERTVRTGYLTKHRGMPDYGDIDGTPGISWQVKNVEPARWSRVPIWLAQTEMQRGASRADIGLLVVRRPGRADPARWWVWLMARALVDLGSGGQDSTFSERPDLAVPVCLELADLAPILRQAGYGTPPEATP